MELLLKEPNTTVQATGPDALNRGKVRMFTTAWPEAGKVHPLPAMVTKLPPPFGGQRRPRHFLNIGSDPLGPSFLFLSETSRCARVLSGGGPANSVAICMLHLENFRRRLLRGFLRISSPAIGMGHCHGVCHDGLGCCPLERTCFTACLKALLQDA